MTSRATTTTPLISVEGIPPLEPYLTRRRQSPGDYAAQLMFAAVLFEREIYYTVLYGPHSPHGKAPPAAHLGAWQPFPATVAAAAAPTRDLFGLKAEALAGILKAMGRAKPRVVGTLLAAAFAADLGEYEQSLGMAEAVLGRDAGHRRALSYAFTAATWLAGENPRWGARLRGIEASARARFGFNWMNQLALAREAHELDVRRVAWRGRSETEGERFTRFLKTEAQFCGEERDRAVSAFDESVVPESIRPLVPLARRFGVGDDVCRRLFVAGATRAERAGALRRATPLLPEIEAWIARFEPASFPPAVAAFFWLLDALEQMRRG